MNDLTWIEALLTIWIMGLGLAVIFRRPSSYVHHTGRAIRWSFRTVWWHTVVRPVRWAWRRWSSQIVCFIIGVIAGGSVVRFWFIREMHWNPRKTLPWERSVFFILWKIAERGRFETYSFSITNIFLLKNFSIPTRSPLLVPSLKSSKYSLFNPIGFFLN
jgi:hypothetical protein